jgi:antirestriction protein ArdC
MKRDLYADVSARILAELQKGTAPWVKPWHATPGMNHPHNAATNRPYSGCNIVLLWMALSANGWTSPRFLTFKQAQTLGGNVRKGEHGIKIYFVKQMRMRDTSEPNSSEQSARFFPMLREYTVFNVAQCDGLPANVITPKPIAPRHQDRRDPIAEAFLNTTGVEIRENGDRAVYYSGPDFVGMPSFASFKSADHYYATLFHETGHWTGHRSRLDRDLRNRFGDRQYAAEELIAELTSAFLCAEFSIEGDLRHASYIASWIDLLKVDPRAFMTAASKAQAAADYLRGLALEGETTEEDDLAEAA